MKLILASSSPRRRELLAGLGLAFDVIQSDADESFSPGSNPRDIVTDLARRKALTVARQAAENDKTPALVIGADTIVVHEDRILGKPKNEQDAIQTLTSLQGDTHEVWTAVCVVETRTMMLKMDAACTKVQFVPLTQDEIRQYVQTGEPMDKAGSYGIQKIGALLVEGIQGDYFTVMGLPVRKTAELLREFGVNVLTLAAENQTIK